MADKPILFSGPMVRALLAGTKTQTRRVINPQPFISDNDWAVNVRGTIERWHVTLADVRIHVGDRLYVRERWVPLAPGGDMAPIADATYSMTVDGAHQHRDGRYSDGLGEGKYADGAFDRIKWRPGIHMPRWASRITLHVTEVRVQRLQDITEDDAEAEGVDDAWLVAHHVPPPRVLSYRDLWNAINGEGAWDANPWVAATSFEVEKINIAQARA